MGIEIKKLDARKSITLDDGYKFKCFQCGKCCKNYKIKDPKSKQEFYAYDPRGKLSKITSFIPTAYYDEIKAIESYFEQKRMEFKENLFVPSMSIFLKNFKVEFVIRYWLMTENGTCIFFNNKKKSCAIYPVRPLVCRIYPVSFYLNNDKRSGLLNVKSDCSAIEKEWIEKNSNFQPNEYAVFGKTKNFSNINKNLEYDSYRLEKFNMFLYVWGDFFIDLSIISPEIVKGYQRLDISQFWDWILENKNKISPLKKVKRYKELLSKLYELYNFKIKKFLE